MNNPPSYEAPTQLCSPNAAFFFADSDPASSTPQPRIVDIEALGKPTPSNAPPTLIMSSPSLMMAAQTRPSGTHVNVLINPIARPLLFPYCGKPIPPTPPMPPPPTPLPTVTLADLENADRRNQTKNNENKMSIWEMTLAMVCFLPCSLVMLPCYIDAVEEEMDEAEERRRVRRANRETGGMYEVQEQQARLQQLQLQMYAQQQKQERDIYNRQLRAYELQLEQYNQDMQRYQYFQSMGL